MKKKRTSKTRITDVNATFAAELLELLVSVAWHGRRGVVSVFCDDAGEINISFREMAEVETHRDDAEYDAALNKALRTYDPERETLVYVEDYESGRHDIFLGGLHRLKLVAQ